MLYPLQDVKIRVPQAGMLKSISSNRSSHQLCRGRAEDRDRVSTSEINSGRKPGVYRQRLCFLGRKRSGGLSSLPRSQG